jgi:hypothetical protein
VATFISDCSARTPLRPIYKTTPLIGEKKEPNHIKPFSRAITKSKRSGYNNFLKDIRINNCSKELMWS